jgi:hypothetical protein
MSNEIIPVGQPAPLQTLEVYDRITNPMEAVKALGQSIFKSGLFGCDRPEQGEVLAMQCLTERKSPLELARTYHFIQGQLAIRADALLAKFQMMGGQVQWLERTDIKVVAIFGKPGSGSAQIVADIEEYKKNGTAYKADGKSLKDNWVKWPRRMLTARAISEGVRLVAPECCFGTYVVEELQGDSPRFGRKTVPVGVNTVAELVPAEQHDAAVAMLMKANMLEEGQTLADLAEVHSDSILRSPGPFMTAVNQAFSNK